MLSKKLTTTPARRQDTNLANWFEQAFWGFPSLSSTPTTSWPRLDAWEADGVWTLEFEVPGFRLEDLELEVNGRELSIRGDRSEATDDKAGTWHRRERYLGQFQRVLRLPANVDPASIEASLKDGLLQIRLQRDADSLPRKIEVKPSQD